MRDSAARAQAAAAAPAVNDGDDLSGQSAGQARSSDEDAFPQAFGDLPSNPLDLGPGVELDHWVGDSAAVVSDDGRKALAESMTPVRVEDGGQLRPVDLDVISDGGGFAPVRPVSETRFPDAASGGFVFGDGLTASLSGASSASHGAMAGSQIFYPSAYQDTDLAVAPSPIGLEILVMARSAQSPEEYRIHLSLPDGAALSAPQAADGTVQGTVSIVEGDRVVGSVPPPMAADANGAAQPASYRIDGDDLLLEAPRGADMAYPELIDPNPQDSQFSSESDVNGHLIDAVGWTQEGTMPTGFTFAPTALSNGHLGAGSYGTNCTVGTRTIGNSLCVSTKAGVTYTGTPGQHDDWDFFPPSGADPATRSAGDSYVYRFDARTAFYGTGSTYQYGGLYRGAVNPAFVGSGQDFVSDTGTNGSWSATPYVSQANSGSSSGLRRYCLTTSCVPDDAGVTTNSSTRAFFGTIASGTNVTGQTSLMGAAMYESDATPPSGDGSNPTNPAYTMGATPAWNESAWYKSGPTSVAIKPGSTGGSVRWWE